MWVALNGIIFVPNFVKICRLVQKLKRGDTAVHTDTRHYDLMSLS